RWGKSFKHDAASARLCSWCQPSPEGRGWPAAGAFTGRSGPGEGFLLFQRGGSRPTYGFAFKMQSPHTTYHIPHTTYHIPTYRPPLPRLYHAPAGQQVGLQEGIDVPVEDAVSISHFKFRPMVLNEPIGVQNVGPDLAAKIDICL